jgi:hypothetical protein
MALIVEDGTGMATAESYTSVAEADLYFSNRANTAWAALGTPAKEASLRKATDYMGQVYRLRWKGVRVNGVQALDWPRGFVERDDYKYQGVNGASMIGGYFYFPSDEVPKEVKNACAELALKASSEELAPDLGQGIIREKIGPLETEYDKNSPQYTRYRAIDNLLATFLISTNNGINKPVVRV